MKKLTLSAITAALICTVGATCAATGPTVFNTFFTNTAREVTGINFTIYYPPLLPNTTSMMLLFGRNVLQYTPRKVPAGAYTLPTSLMVKGKNIAIPINLRHKIYNNCALVIGPEPKDGFSYQLLYQAGGMGASNCYYTPTP